MKLYFRSGARGYHERGWYEFWVAYDENDIGYIFRIPVDKRDVSDRIADGVMSNPQIVRRATPIEVAMWLAGHSQEPHNDERYAVIPTAVLGLIKSDIAGRL
jgi:hypothetical protein